MLYFIVESIVIEVFSAKGGEYYGAYGNGPGIYPKVDAYAEDAFKHPCFAAKYPGFEDFYAGRIRRKCSP